eukprot:11798831-Alexandrium_andersonii.AAC.1
MARQWCRAHWRPTAKPRRFSMRCCALWPSRRQNDSAKWGLRRRRGFSGGSMSSACWQPDGWRWRCVGGATTQGRTTVLIGTACPPKGAH